MPDEFPLDKTSEPFRGPSEFRYADRAIFRAREEETRVIVQSVLIYKGSLLYGESGNGKSSIINAGLCPELILKGFTIDRLRVQPAAGAEIRVERIQVAESTNGPFLFSTFADEHETEKTLSLDQFRRTLEQKSGTRRLLIFDQFEEIMTQFNASIDAEREMQMGIIRMLTELYFGNLSVKLLLVFRDDYLAAMTSLLEETPDWLRQSFWLRAPKKQRVREIIASPFESKEFPERFSKELIDALEMEIRDRPSEGVPLTDLQIACLGLWRTVDPEAEYKLRGIQGLIELYLESSLAVLNVRQRVAGIALLATMVTALGTRNTISESDAIEKALGHGDFNEDDCRAAVLELLRCRLMRSQRQRGAVYFDIVSEYLIPWILKKRRETEFRGIDDNVRRAGAAEISAARIVIEQKARQERIRFVITAAALALIGLGGSLYVVKEMRSHERPITIPPVTIVKPAASPPAGTQTISPLLLPKAKSVDKEHANTMLGSNILDAVIGVAFLFLLISLVCTSAAEALSGVLSLRARSLRRGIQNLLRDPGLVEHFYRHPLVESLAIHGPPSYIPARIFATVLIDIAFGGQPTGIRLQGIDVFQRLQEGNMGLARALGPVVSYAESYPQVIAAVEDWYNAAMDAVSGSYKFDTQIRLTALATLITLGLNLDCINIANRFLTDPTVRSTVVAQAQADIARTPPDPRLREHLDQAERQIETHGLPVGWSQDNVSGNLDLFRKSVAHIPGWLISIFALTLGAPFWFDFLNRFIVIRSTAKPSGEGR